MSNDHSRPRTQQNPTLANRSASDAAQTKTQQQYESGRGCLMLITIGVVSLILMFVAAMLLGDFT